MKRKLTIIGGGITGLSAAYLAVKDGWKVTVLEGSSQVGGLMSTFRIGGNRLERYYHHHFMNDAELLWLLKELNIEDQLEFRKTTMGIFRNNRVFDFNSPADLLQFTPMKPIDKARFIISSLYLGKLAKWQKWESVSALEWFYKYAGRNATDSVWRPMLGIKFGPYASSVPVAWMVGRLKQRLNSRKGTEERLGYLKGSLQTLTDKLTARLRELGVDILLKAKVEKLSIIQNRLTGVKTAQGVFSDGIFLATLPIPHLVSMLRDDAPVYAKELSDVEYIEAVCTVLELDRQLSHIYWLNVADPGFPFGGIIEHTNFIPPDEYNGSHIVYLSRYYEKNDSLAKASKKEILDRMIAQLNRINPQFSPKWIKNAYVFRSNTAATVCGLNFSSRVPDCKTPITNLFIVNMSHIYPDERSCNNSIRTAAQACRKIGVDSSMVPFGTSLSGQIGMD
ncbi:MAG: NAD(P)/FAD-dependent oxidoreductase [Nitrospirota bacterium]